MISHLINKIFKDIKTGFPLIYREDLSSTEFYDNLNNFLNNDLNQDLIKKKLSEQIQNLLKNFFPKK